MVLYGENIENSLIATASFFPESCTGEFTVAGSVFRVVPFV
jgi:hypothetical protein